MLSLREALFPLFLSPLPRSFLAPRVTAAYIEVNPPPLFSLSLSFSLFLFLLFPLPPLSPPPPPGPTKRTPSEPFLSLLRAHLNLNHLLLTARVCRIPLPGSPGACNYPRHDVFRLFCSSTRIFYHSPFVRLCGKTAGRRRINLLPCMAVDNGGEGLTRQDDALLLYVCNLQRPNATCPN